jgi:uncharacterized protein
MCKPTAIIRFFLIFTLSIAAQVFAAEDRGIFWEAEKNGQKIYLLGSIHLASKSFYPLRGAIEKAYVDSDALVVEADILAIESNTALQQQIIAESLYPPGEDLRDHISPEIYAKLLTWLQQRGLPEQMFLRQRPAIAMVTLSMVEMQALGLTANQGIDRHFLNQAHTDQKSVLELESVIEQLKLLNSLDNPDQYLQQTLEQLAELKTFVPQLTESWKTGNTAQLHQLVIADGLKQHPEYKLLFEVLFFERNRTMTEKLQKLSKSHPTLFVVVGAGHLVGDRGIIKLLQKSGYSTRQI